MNGTGVGFSVEEEYVNKLPSVAEEFYETESVIVVRDSKLGWARGTERTPMQCCGWVRFPHGIYLRLDQQDLHSKLLVVGHRVQNH